MANKILNLFYQKPTIIFLILAFSIYLDTSGFAISAIEFKKTKSFELLPFFILIVISAVITAVIILFIIRKIVYESKVFPKEVLIYFKIVSISQILIISLISIILGQILLQNIHYYFLSVIAGFISLFIGLFFGIILTIKSFKWYKHSKGYTILEFFITVILISSFIISSILYFSYSNINTTNIVLEPMNIKGQVVFGDPPINKLQIIYDIVYLCLFLFTWIIILTLMINYLEKKRKTLIVIYCIPLIYTISIYYFYTFGHETITSLTMSNRLFGTVYTILFTGTIPLTGILFFIPLHLFASKIKNNEIKKFSIMTAFGILIFFTANQVPPLQQKFFPPFGVIAVSFTGFSIFLFFLGMYSNVIYLARSSQLKNVVLAKLYNDKFLRQIAKSEFEQDLRLVINKISKDVEIDASYSTELKKDDIENVIRNVRKEFESMRYKGS
jgi:hypothetical protein